MVCPFAPITFFMVGGTIFKPLFFVLELGKLTLVVSDLSLQFGDVFLFCHSV